MSTVIQTFIDFLKNFKDKDDLECYVQESVRIITEQNTTLNIDIKHMLESDNDD